MPVCKNCKSRIDKFNKDRCPICGVEHPFDGVTSDTIEITTSLDVDALNFKPRKKVKFLILSILVGFFGINFFYMYKAKAGVIALICNILLIGVCGFLLGKFTIIGYGASFGIFIGLCFAINAVIGLINYLTPNLKDGHGEFVL